MFLYTPERHQDRERSPCRYSERARVCVASQVYRPMSGPPSWFSLFSSHCERAATCSSTKKGVTTTFYMKRTAATTHAVIRGLKQFPQVVLRRGYLSYQHGYHAGNQADVHKHMVLCTLLQALVKMTGSVMFADTHAGRGLYDLTSPFARKTGEAAAGIARLRLADLPEPYRDAVASIRAEYGTKFYPGSPMLASRLLRMQDHLVLYEQHPAEHRALLQRMASNRRRHRALRVHRADGPTGVLALAKYASAGLVLVDPSYEIKTEYSTTAKAVEQLAMVWPRAVIMVWYPLLHDQRHFVLKQGLSAAATAAGVDLLYHQIPFPAARGGLLGSGVAVLNSGAYLPRSQLRSSCELIEQILAAR